MLPTLTTTSTNPLVPSCRLDHDHDDQPGVPGHAVPDEPGHPVHPEVVEHPVVRPRHHLVCTGRPATSVETSCRKMSKIRNKFRLKLKKEEAIMVKPQLTSVSSVVIDLARINQHRVGVKKLMALKRKITLIKQRNMNQPYLSAPPAC